MVVYLSLNFILLSAQSTVGNDITGFNLPLFNSPQVNSLLRFDQSSIDAYTGKIDLTVPLINFEDKDFEIPISIKYNSGGFRPTEADNFVGNSWTLIPNFVIYREVKGVPDDFYEHNISDAIYREDPNFRYSDMISGFLKVKNNGLKINAETYKKEILSNPHSETPLGHTGLALMKYGLSLNSQKTVRTGIEASSDIYRFFCGKYSGHFMIDFDGQIKSESTSGGAVEVNINNYNIVDAYNPPSNNTSEISIRTDDGFYYVFGGDYSAMEYTALSWESFNNPAMEPSTMQVATPVVTAFFLTKIIAPNGRVLTINYDNYVKDTYHKKPRELAKQFNDEELRETRRRYQLSGISSTKFITSGILAAGRNNFGITINNKQIKQIFSLRKLAFIKSISVDNKKVIFNYSNKEKNILEIDKTPNVPLYGFHPTPLKLDNVTYSVGAQIIDKVDFKYYDNGRLFLTELQSKRNGKYQFQYNAMTSNAISPLTTNIDHWGFVIDGIVEGFIPSHTWKDEIGSVSTVYFTSIAKDRDPRNSGFDKYVLSEVKYPTGGKHKYIYELHDYNNEVRRGLDERFFPSYKNINGAAHIAGGTRIKKIRFYDQNNAKVKETHFAYKESIDSEISSGILYNKPIYMSPIIIINQGTPGEVTENPTAKMHMVANSAGLNGRPKDSGHIAYTSVIEINYLEQIEKAAGYKYLSKDYLEMIKQNGYQKTTFTSWHNGHSDYLGGTANSPDRVYVWTGNDKKLDSEAERIYDIQYQQFGLWKNGIREMLDLSQERGMLLKKTVYNSTNKPISEEEFTYQRFPYLGNAPQNDDKYTLYINSPYEFPYTGCVKLYAQVARKPFYQFKVIKKQTKYWENSGINKIEQFDYTNDGIYLTSVNETDSRGNIRQNNYEYGFKSKAAPYIPSSITKEYLVNNNKHNYSKYYNYDITKNIANTEKYAFDNQQTLSDVKLSYGENTSLITDLECRKYDKYGNPVYVIGQDNNPIIFLWSYYGQYPIAKIEGASYDQIYAHNINADVLSGRNSPDPTEYDAIRKLEEKISGIHITTYKYKPAVGIISMTDPSGKTTYYDYDSSNRLTRVYIKELDENNKEVVRLLHSYNYHYINK